jgi:hypothetical protein
MLFLTHGESLVPERIQGFLIEATDTLQEVQ